MIEEELQIRVHRYLCLYARGATRAKTGKDLAEYFKTDWRTIAAMVRQLRLNGVLIGSSKGNNRSSLTQTRNLPGYYIPETDQEKDTYLTSFRHELFDMLRTYNRQKKARLKEAEDRKTKDLFKINPSGQQELILAGER